jgi:uncharacterized membrane protein YeaQ/YmgE (transglycosylase-associated protein family)
MYVLAFILFGFVVGLIARAIMPGPQRLGLLMTTLLGVGGSLVGGFVGNLMFSSRWNEPATAGWIGSILGAVILLAIVGGIGRTAAHT